MQSYAKLFHLPHHKSEYLSLLYVVALIRTFVFLLLGLFLPVFIFKNFLEDGFSEKSAFLLVILAFLFLQTTHGFLVTLASKINARFGVRVGFLIGQFFLIVFLFILFSSQNTPLVFLNFVLWGVAASFYWISYHTFFLEVGKPKKFGEELGFLEMLGIFTGLIAPILAGIIITFFGFTTLFVICLILVLLSMIFLIFVKDIEELEPVNFLDVKNEVLEKRRDFISFIGIGGEEIIYSVAWPLLLFTIFQNYVEVGITASIVVLIAGIAALIAGKLSDRVEKNKIEKIGSASIAVTFVGRIFFQTPISLYIIDSLYKIFSNFFYLPLTALAYAHAMGGDKTRYVVFREVGHKVGNILGLASFMLILGVGLPFWWVFIFGAIFSLLPMMMKEKIGERKEK
ncbi:MFS transporter [candidate division WWE3 bacterium]|nr:MFS transporter [candidate division WWE3 bacterium]